MKLIRKIINSDKLRQIIRLPDELKHKKVEVIILPVIESKTPKNKQKGFNPEDFIGAMKIKNIDRKIRSIRAEWERV